MQLRDYHNKEIKWISPDEEVNPLIEIICGAYKHKTNKAVSRLYLSLIQNLKNTSLYVKEKWENELQVNITENEWYQSCDLLQTSTSSQQWREFNWKCLIRFFITPNIKSKQIGVPQECWRGCGDMEVGHTHIFWSCNKIQPFWELVNNTLKNIFGYNIPNDCKVMYLGNIKAVTRLWLKPNTPNEQQWTNLIQNIYDMERLTYIIRLKESSFHKKWRKWTIYQTSDT